MQLLHECDVHRLQPVRIDKVEDAVREGHPTPERALRLLLLLPKHAELLDDVADDLLERCREIGVVAVPRRIDQRDLEDDGRLVLDAVLDVEGGLDLVSTVGPEMSCRAPSPRLRCRSRAGIVSMIAIVDWRALQPASKVGLLPLLLDELLLDASASKSRSSLFASSFCLRILSPP